MASTDSGLIEETLVARWRAGDQDAAAEIARLHTPALLAVVRARLAGRFARRLDAEDVVQSALAGFFRDARKGNYELDAGGDLWKLLAAITRHKLAKQVRRHLTGRRSVRSEAVFDGPEAQDATLEGGGRRGAAAPLQEAAFAELLDDLLAPLPPHHRPIVELRLEGFDLDGIAEAVGCCRRTVQRVLDGVKARLSAGGDF